MVFCPRPLGHTLWDIKVSGSVLTLLPLEVCGQASQRDPDPEPDLASHSANHAHAGLEQPSGFIQAQVGT